MPRFTSDNTYNDKRTLEERGPVTLFKSQRWSIVQNNSYGDSPIYTVWNGDEIVYCGENYKEACNKVEGLINDTATLNMNR